MRELAALRLANMRGPFYPGTDGALAFHRTMIEHAAERGEVLRLHDRAFLAHWVESRHPHRHLVIVHRRDGDDQALAWCRATLDAVIPTIGEDLEVSLTGHEVALREHLLAMEGLGINAVFQAGRVEHALRNLGSVPSLPEGMVCRQQRLDDLEALVDLQRRVVLDEPVYFWFGADEEMLEATREANRARTEAGHGWVLEQEGQILGHFSFAAYPRCVHHGSSAGVALLFDRAIRGRGLSKLAYQVMLTSMQADGIRWIKGVTARKPVLHLGRRMGRGTIGVWIRRNHTFPPGWFGLQPSP